MSRLHEIGLRTGTDKATCHEYCAFYEENLPADIGRLLEVGVWEGASLEMWREYYPAAEIVGVDLAIRRQVPGCVLLEGDGTDPTFLGSLGRFDIIVDDGSHLCSDQQATFAYAYENLLLPGGVFVMEDLQTSFWESYTDTDITTFEMLTSSGLDVTIWSRLEDYSESTTAIIRKPS